MLLSATSLAESESSGPMSLGFTLYLRLFLFLLGLITDGVHIVVVETAFYVFERSTMVRRRSFSDCNRE